MGKISRFARNDSSALADGDAKIFEGTAICMYLGDKFIQARLAPAIGAPPSRPALEAYVDRLLARPEAMKFGK